MFIEKENNATAKNTGKSAGQAAVSRLPGWTMGLIPLLAIGLLLFLFTVVNPLSMFNNNLPPVEVLSIERIRVVEGGFELSVLNSGPHAVNIAQVMVDDAYWQFRQEPAGALNRFERATVHIPYQWIRAEPHRVRLVTNTGLIFEDEVPVAVLTPRPGMREFAGYGLLGIYVGVIPVTLGLLWYPAMKRMGRRWLGFILALTVGLLVFLLVDTFLEVLEMAAELPNAFQGLPLALFSALLTWLAIMAVSSMQKRGRKSVNGTAPNKAVSGAQEGGSVRTKGAFLATLIALSIGLHNFGEGLAVGASFAMGEAALGSFLVIGFILHNITEGIGIAAPLVPNRRTEGQAAGGEEPAKTGPSLLTFAGLALLAGFPAVLGTWIGGFAFSPLLGAIFLGIGLGAIWQVIVEVTSLLRRYAERDGTPFVSWLNLAGFLLGLAIMYLTAFLVKF